MANNTYNFIKAVTLTDYYETFTEGWDNVAKFDWKQFTTIKNTGRSSEQMYSWYGVGLPIQIGEQEPYSYYDAGENAATTVTISKWGYASRFSYELIDFAKGHGHIKDLMRQTGKQMGTAHRYLRDARVSRFFDRLTTDTAYDSVAFAGTHTLKDGSSLDNDLTAASFNFDNFWSMIDHFTSSVKNHSGMYTFPTPKWLVAHPVLGKKIEKVLRTDREPDTADNNTNTLLKKNNPFLSGQIIPVYTPLLTSQTQYVLLAEEFKDDFYFFDHKKPTFTEGEDFDTDAYKIKSMQQFGLGCKSFMNLVNNAGA